MMPRPVQSAVTVPVESRTMLTTANRPMKPRKILAVVSSVDLSFRYGCTPAWWQLWKALHNQGVDLIVLPECAITGYVFDSANEAAASAQELPGPALEVLEHGGHNQRERVGHYLSLIHILL